MSSNETQLNVTKLISVREFQQRPPRLKERSVKHLRIVDKKTLYEIYEFKEEIGHGTYGTVISAIEKQTSKNYAIKIVNKFTTGANQLQEVYSEIKILKSVDHPNIICLERVYESPRKIYMVLEKCSDNLSSVLKQEKSLTEKVTKKIIKQLVSAVYYLHKNDIVHRDIKLENILLANNPSDPSDKYFIKLSDFGLSIIKTGAGIQGMLKEYCGTVIYMAPEILLQHSYSELCDVWPIGVILYLLLFGEFPFFSSNEDELSNKICNSAPVFQIQDGAVSYEAIDLIKCLLEKDPANRITSLEILQHPWMTENKVKQKDVNVLEYMKKWRSEMKISIDDEPPDWISNMTDIGKRGSTESDASSTKANKEVEPMKVCLAASQNKLNHLSKRKNCSTPMM
ncbi:serine/threonine-protein kinase 33-like [Anoplophora glabripennis]|uniref:serine/threonine-protein kinase 33-like n=1 Tax=Anoplophora glabripennis TaxID=217634 RepID=UPI0008757A12|nr:serine/threonine-protein kinase 33-like [Anoplophora glabripennis]